MSSKKILYENLGNLKEETFIKYIAELQGLILSQNDNVLVLINLEGTFISNIVKEKLENLFLSCDSCIRASAVIGAVKGVRRLIIESLKYPFYIAVDIEDGEDWLESQ